MKNRFSLFSLLIGLVIVLNACQKDEIQQAVINDSSDFVAPVLNNNATADSAVFSPDMDANTFEKFSWDRAQYGADLPVNYSLEVSTADTFAVSMKLASTGETSAEVTVKSVNDALLALGAPAFSPASAYFRVMATVDGGNVDTLYSNMVERNITAYRLSDCGNFCSIGIIGDATPGGWTTDTDMHLADPNDKYTWTVTLYLNAGGAKFRASDDWGTNWGSADFPSGTGTQDGSNIAIPTAGYYKVTFNDNTGAYSFTSLNPSTFGSIGIIGDATPGGWNTDTDLTQDANDAHLWTGTVTLTAAQAKFRADNDWAVNWGGTTYPSGYGIGGGDNINVDAGTYNIYFHDVTGFYSFMNDATVYTNIGVIGDATANGWNSDTDLTQNPQNPYLWSGFVTLKDGEVKIRANHDWAVNWGGVDFPAGVGVSGGPNIKVDAGTYFVTFNSGTGEYKFLK